MELKTNDILVDRAIIHEDEVHWYRPKIDFLKCILCKSCVSVCKRNVYTLKDECVQITEDNLKKCIGCFNCINNCPTDAITVIDYPYKKMSEPVNHFFNLAEARQSVREYSDRIVEREKLINCVNVARLAPNARNAEQIHFIIVDDKDISRKLANLIHDKENHTNSFLSRYPCSFIVLVTKISDEEVRNIPTNKFSDIDCGLYSAYICLAAAEEGLATCILGAGYTQEAVKELLHIPEKNKVSLIISIGYPKIDYIRKKGRKAFKDISSFNSF